MGKVLDLHHQLCIAHGIHLAVCDILYGNLDVQQDTMINDDTGNLSSSDTDTDPDDVDDSMVLNFDQSPVGALDTLNTVLGESLTQNKCFAALESPSTFTQNHH